MLLRTYAGKANYRDTVLTFVEVFFKRRKCIVFYVRHKLSCILHSLLLAGLLPLYIHTNNVDSVDTLLIST